MKKTMNCKNPKWCQLLAAIVLFGMGVKDAAYAWQPDVAKQAIQEESSHKRLWKWSLPDVFLRSVDPVEGLQWPADTSEARLGSYWWWPGNAVTKEGLTWNLETYRQAGWGNMGVIGIYGVKGEENRFIDIFTPEWFEMYNHAVEEADRLGMNIDLTPSSGWRWGGPHITPQYAEQSFSVKKGRIHVKTHKDKVKRAGPGGKGRALNPYSKAAVKYHLDWVTERFREGDGRWPRAFYYDSFENRGNWCPEFLDAFKSQHGYDLADHANELGGKGDAEKVRRVRCDYRETLSDLLLESVELIVEWGAEYGSGLRMQAHGAPANLLDMYAAASIPETEVFGANHFDIPGFRRDPKLCRLDKHSPLVNRFASSAAHVAGRNIVISESFTWLRNHYHTALSHIKAEADNLLLNGINGIYYHGTCFAPPETAWPGWLFYASTQVNVRNSIFRDILILNQYITRCQSVLQNGKPHNDILLYWPVYDLWMKRGGNELRFKVHNPDAWIDKTKCGHAGRWMLDNGYTFDFVSDKQIESTRLEGDALVTAGKNDYRTILVPAAEFMKFETARSLLELAADGATVLFWEKLPSSVPGLSSYRERAEQLHDMLGELYFDSNGVAKIGKGKVVTGNVLDDLLSVPDVDREPMADLGLKFIRRKTESHYSYFIANHTSKKVNAWVPLGISCRSAGLMDPMSGKSGVAQLRSKEGRTEIFLQMQPGETRVLRAFPREKISGSSWPIIRAKGEPAAVEGRWKVEFVEGGPKLPESFTTNELRLWTQLGGDEAKRFAGAARYTVETEVPARSADRWLLDLGDVRESARVWVNGQPAGARVAPPYRVDVTDQIKPGKNRIAIEVTNLSANRLRDLDKRGVQWKKFYDINIVNQNYKNINPSNWDLKPSGLLGPVTLQPAAELTD